MDQKPGPFEVKKSALGNSRPAQLPHNVQTLHVPSSEHEEPAIAANGHDPHAPLEAVDDSSALKKDRPHLTLLCPLHGAQRRAASKRTIVPVVAGTEVEDDDDDCEDSPFRNFDCSNYNKCLSLAAALDWDSFTCEGCNLEINEQLIWRAHHRLRSDPYLARLFSIPVVSPDGYHEPEPEQVDPKP